MFQQLDIKLMKFGCFWLLFVTASTNFLHAFYDC